MYLCFVHKSRLFTLKRLNLFLNLVQSVAPFYQHAAALLHFRLLFFSVTHWLWFYLWNLLLALTRQKPDCCYFSGTISEIKSIFPIRTYFLTLLKTALSILSQLFLYRPGHACKHLHSKLIHLDGSLGSLYEYWGVMHLSYIDPPNRSYCYFYLQWTMSKWIEIWQLVIFSIWEQCTMGILLRGVGDENIDFSSCVAIGVSDHLCWFICWALTSLSSKVTNKHCGLYLNYVISLIKFTGFSCTFLVDIPYIQAWKLCPLL